MNALLRWGFTLALAVSVGGNVYLVRSALGERAAAPPVAVERVLEQRSARMTPEDAAVLRHALDGSREAIRTATRAAREARATARALMGAEPVDVAAVEAALAEVRARNAEQQEVLHGLYLGVARQLSQEGRVVLIDRGPRAARAPSSAGPAASEPSAKAGR